MKYEFNDLPKCPHCDYDQEDWWDGSHLSHDDDTEQQGCQSCGEDFKITMHVSYSFSTEKTKGEN